MTGKGSNRRPQEVDEQTMADNWDRIFGANEPRIHLIDGPGNVWDGATRFDEVGGKLTRRGPVSE